MQSRFTLLAAALAIPATLLLTQTVSAEEPLSEGLYIGLAAGGNKTRHSDITGPGINTVADFKWGWGAAATLGYNFSGPFRTEFEFSHRRNEVDTIGGVGGVGRMQSFGLMANVLYDIDLGMSVTPYFGGGIGAARVRARNVAPVGGSFINDRDVKLAYQAIGGLAFALTPRTALSVDYRYFASRKADLVTSTGTPVDAEYKNHAVMLGIRFALGGPAQAEPAPAPVAEPAPAPAPMPVAEPARNYLVFFDWDSTVLSQQSLDIIAEAASTARAQGNVKIDVTGHADKSGSDDYNLGLSRRRAQAVIAELERQGVPAGDIAAFARGESDPLVPTADGVREPQNRRVQIMLN